MEIHYGRFRLAKSSSRTIVKLRPPDFEKLADTPPWLLKLIEQADGNSTECAINKAVSRLIEKENEKSDGKSEP